MWKKLIFGVVLCLLVVDVFAQNTALPVREYSVTERGDSFCILLTGEDGWKGVSVSMAYFLQQHNLPVVGLDVSDYLWKSHEPREIAQDLQTLIATYQKKWGRLQVVLVGYSLGANVLPAAVNQLPPLVRAQVNHLVLVAPTRMTDYAVTFGSMLNLTHGNHPVLPELKKITYIPVLVVCDDAQESLCKELKDTPVFFETLGGGHAFGGKWSEMNALIWSKIEATQPE